MIHGPSRGTDAGEFWLHVGAVRISVYAFAVGTPPDLHVKVFLFYRLPRRSLQRK